MPGTDRKIVPEKVENKKGEEKGGLLAPVANPIGGVLEGTLAPLGKGIGQVTGPVAEGASNVSKPLMDKLDLPDRGELKEDEEKRKEKFGGKDQTGQNPLGL